MRHPICAVSKNFARFVVGGSYLTSNTVNILRVNRRVANDFESYNPDEPDNHGLKQIPCFNSMLTRLYMWIYNWIDRQIDKLDRFIIYYSIIII